MLLAAPGCGDACVGYTSFTDANGIVVLIGCDGYPYVPPPTPVPATNRVGLSSRPRSEIGADPTADPIGGRSDG